MGWKGSPETMRPNLLLKAGLLPTLDEVSCDFWSSLFQDETPQPFCIGDIRAVLPCKWRNFSPVSNQDLPSCNLKLCPLFYCLFYYHLHCQQICYLSCSKCSGRYSAVSALILTLMFFCLFLVAKWMLSTWLLVFPPVGSASFQPILSLFMQPVLLRLPMGSVG